MRVLITGGNGQLGRSIASEKPRDWVLTITDRATLDITKREQVDTFFHQGQFDLCINCAAYTAVDLAESNEELCRSVNEHGARNIARACASSGCNLIHMSTDYVYHSEEGQPLTEESPTQPRSVYARTKLDGERAVLREMAGAIVIRSSWIFSEYGKNFFLTILRLARNGTIPRVIADQRGTPTYARDLANCLIAMANAGLGGRGGVYNLSNVGETTWCGFASEIFRLVGIYEMPIAIPTSEYPTPALRPPYSVMSMDKVSKTFGIVTRSWQEAVKECYRRVAS